VVNPADPVTVGISPNDTICNGVTATLMTSSSNPTYIYNWTDDQGNPVGSGTSVNITPVANTTYYLSAVDANSCTVLDTLEVTVKGVPPTTVTLASPDEVCVVGDVDLTIDPIPAFGIDYQWQKDDGFGFVDIVGATDPAYTEVGLTVTTSYQVQAYCDGALAGTSSPVTVTVNNPQLLSTMGATRCGDGTVDLQATADPGVIINWYDTPTGGTALDTGSIFTTPVISSTTDFYVSASTGDVPTEVGPTDLSIGSYATWNSTAQWLNFTVYSTVTIQSVDMFFQTVGAAFSIVIRDASSLATVFTYNGTTTVASTTTAQVVPINATLPPGNYQMNLGTTVGTYRNSTGGVYPYTIPGVLSITGNTFDPVYYYMFYRWVVGAGCESPRVPVTAVVNPADPVT